MTNRRILIPILIVLCSSRVVMGQGAIPRDRAIDVIRAIESKIHRAQWEVSCSIGRFRNLADPGSRELSGELREGWVVFEPMTGRFRLELKRMTRWYSGLHPYAAYLTSRSFDGDRERQLEIQKPGKSLPDPDDEGFGDIWASAQDYLVKGGIDSGTGFFPCRYEGRPISSVLEEHKTSLEVNEDGKGLWNIKFVSRDEFEDIHTLSFDPSRGLLVGASLENGPPGKIKVWRQLYVEPRQVGADFWAPAVLRWVNLNDKTFTETTYRNVKINHPIDDIIFHVAFPPGTKVDDHTGGKERRYTVGSGPEGDLAAIKKFMLAEGLAMSSTSEGSAGWITYTAITVAGVLSCIIIGWIIFKKVPRKNSVSKLGAPVFFVTMLVSNQSGLANEQYSNSNSDIEHKLLSNCGFNVTAFALEYFSRNCNAVQVASALRPTEKGVSLAAIQMVLEAHGLQATPRKHVSAADLHKALGPGILAIVPIKPLPDQQLNHYVVGALHPTRGVLIIDVPATTTALVEDNMADLQSSLSVFDGMVLFVKLHKRPNRRSSSNLIHTNSTSIDLGSFSREQASEKVTADFVLENKSSIPVMISHIELSCGCFASGWAGGLIRPSAKQTLPITVFPGSWPAGRRTLPVTAVFGDGSRISFEISANKEQSSFVGPPSLSQRSVRFDLTSVPRTQQFVESECVLSYEQKPVIAPVVTSSVSWLSHQIETINPKTFRVLLTIDTRCKELRDRNHADAIAKLLYCDELSPIPIKVSVFRQRFFKLSRTKFNLVIGDMQGADAKVSVVPTLADGLRVTKVWAEPKGLAVKVTPISGRECRLHVFANSDASPGYYVIKCLLKSTRDQEAVASIVAHVQNYNP